MPSSTLLKSAQSPSASCDSASPTGSNGGTVSRSPTAMGSMGCASVACVGAVSEAQEEKVRLGEALLLVLPPPEVTVLPRRRLTAGLPCVQIHHSTRKLQEQVQISAQG